MQLRLGAEQTQRNEHLSFSGPRRPWQDFVDDTEMLQDFKTVYYQKHTGDQVNGRAL